MHKRKLILIILATLLISGCKKKNSSSEPPRSDGTPTSLITSQDSNEEEHEDFERVITAFTNFYLAPALRLETTVSELTFEETIYTKDADPIDASSIIMLNGLTEITNRDEEAVVFSQTLELNGDERSDTLYMYFADEVLYVRNDVNGENVSKNAMTDMGFLNSLLSINNEEEVFPLVDYFINTAEDFDIIEQNGVLHYSRTIRNIDIALLLAELITLNNEEQNENTIQGIAYLLVGIIEDYFSFEDFTMTAVINSNNNIEQFILAFDLHVTMLHDFELPENFELNEQAIIALLLSLGLTDDRNRTETKIAGEITTLVTIADHINIAQPSDLNEYEM